MLEVRTEAFILAFPFSGTANIEDACDAHSTLARVPFFFCGELSNFRRRGETWSETFGRQDASMLKIWGIAILDIKLISPIIPCSLEEFSIHALYHSALASMK